MSGELYLHRVMDAPWDPLSDALIEGLKDDGRPKRPQVLDLHAATTDLGHWTQLAETTARSQSLSRSDRHNVRETWRKSVKTLGARLRERLGPSIEGLGISLEGNGLQHAETDAATKELLGAIAEPDVCTAAWDDLVESAGAMPGSLRQFEVDCDNFAALLEASDRDLGTFGVTRNLRGVLSGGAMSVLDAQVQLGDKVLDDDWQPDLNDPALQLDVDERLALCRRLVSEPARTGETTVWLRYDSAAFEGGLRMGVATFYGAAHLAARDWQELGDLPPELANEKREREGTLPWLSDPEWGTVFVRVALGRCPVGGAVSRAIDFVETLLNLWSDRDDTWIRTDSHVQYIDGRRATSRGSLRKAADTAGKFGWQNDPTGDRLQEHATRLVSDTLGPSSDLSALSETMRLLSGRAWSAQGRSEVLSGVQAVEYSRANVDPTSEGWDSFALEYLRDAWVFSGTHRDVFSATFSLANHAVAESGPVDEKDIPEIEEAIARLHREYVGVGLEADPAALYTIAVRLGQIANRSWLEYARLQRAIRASSTTKANTMIDELEEDFEVFLSRLTRCRNCLTHGLQVSDGLVESVRSFAISIGTRSTSMEASAILSASDRRSFFIAEAEKNRGRISLIRAGRVAEAFAKETDE